MFEMSWAGDEVPYLTDPRAGDVLVAFTSRRGGVSRPPFDSLNLSSFLDDDPACVERNRARVEEELGLAPSTLTLLKQVHGDTVVESRPGDCGVIGEGDALVAFARGATCGVLTADCVPILLAGPDSIAAVHAGWRGLVAEVIEAAAQRMGVVTRAWVGPSIKACCYEVGNEVIEAFRSRGLPVESESHVDPQGAALHILENLGIEDRAVAAICTSCDERFYSHRRDAPTGRQGAFISWR